MTGRVRTSGSSRWSRSWPARRSSVTNHAPKSANASGSDPNRSGSSPSASAPTSAHDRRPPVDRAGRADAPRRARASASRTGRRRGRARSRRRPAARRAAPSVGGRLACVGAVGGRGSVSRPGRRPAPARRAWRARRRSRPRGANGSGLAVVGRPGDVEVDPRLGHELAQEQAALDQRALGRARVLQVAVPAVHLGDVVVDQRQLPVALAGPVGRRPRPSS